MCITLTAIILVCNLNFVAMQANPVSNLILMQVTATQSLLRQHVRLFPCKLPPHEVHCYSVFIANDGEHIHTALTAVPRSFFLNKKTQNPILIQSIKQNKNVLLYSFCKYTQLTKRSVKQFPTKSVLMQ